MRKFVIADQNCVQTKFPKHLTDKNIVFDLYMLGIKTTLLFWSVSVNVLSRWRNSVICTAYQQELRHGTASRRACYWATDVPHNNAPNNLIIPRWNDHIILTLSPDKGDQLVRFTRQIGAWRDAAKWRTPADSCWATKTRRLHFSDSPW